MVTYRIQFSNTYGWILRNPAFEYPELHHQDKQALPDQLPGYFAKAKEPLKVQVLDDKGKLITTLHYP